MVRRRGERSSPSLSQRIDSSDLNMGEGDVPSATDESEEPRIRPTDFTKKKYKVNVFSIDPARLCGYGDAYCFSGRHSPVVRDCAGESNE